jgi:hypothetical protein
MQGLNQHLIALERELHSRAVRGDRQRLEQLLHADFYEIGRSGHAYTRAATITHLLAEQSAAALHSQVFALYPLAVRVYLLTYQSAELDQDGRYARHSLRSSIWCLEAAHWQLRFHQGTPAELAFSGE